MDDLLSEKEQIEQMRAWWSEYGRYVIAGVVIAAGLLFGYNQYSKSKLAAQTEASERYEQLAEYVTDGDLEAAEDVAEDLAGNYANTSYAAQSKLAMARLYMDKNRDEDAANALRALLELRGEEELKHVGRLRLARILLYQDKAQEAVDLLEGQDNPAFAALYSEILGDAYTALGRITDAGAAYRAALADQAAASMVDRALVQMKLNDLPAATAAATTEAGTGPESMPETEAGTGPEPMPEAEAEASSEVDATAPDMPDPALAPEPEPEPEGGE